jgi:hypothetical protein
VVQIPSDSWLSSFPKSAVQNCCVRKQPAAGTLRRKGNVGRPGPSLTLPARGGVLARETYCAVISRSTTPFILRPPKNNPLSGRSPRWVPPWLVPHDLQADFCRALTGLLRRIDHSPGATVCSAPRPGGSRRSAFMAGLSGRQNSVDHVQGSPIPATSDGQSTGTLALSASGSYWWTQPGPTPSSFIHRTL